MFAVEVHGLWSRDFMTSLSKVVASFLEIEPEEAKSKIAKILDRESLYLYPQTLGQTTELVERGDAAVGTDLSDVLELLP